MLKQFFKKSPALSSSPIKTFKTIQNLLPAKYEPYYRLGRIRVFYFLFYREIR